MAMIITKFHRLIQSRLLWAVFLIVIIFSFVIWGSQISGSRGREAASVSPGRLDGKPVPAEEFRAAWHSAYLGLLLSLGRAPPRSDEVDTLITEMAWKRLASLREARRLGLLTGDEELLTFIQRMPPFLNAQGAFDKDRFKDFTGRVLAGLGYTEEFFGEHLREELTLDKLRGLVQTAVWVSPEEVEASLRRYSDDLVVEYAEIGRDQAGRGIEVSEEAARAEYAANPVRYTLPPRVAVRAAFFPAQAYLEQVAPIPENDLEDYYAEHTAEFRVPAPTLPPDEAAPGAPRTVLAPFEVVRGDIEKKLREAAALRRARDEADAFWRRTAPDIAERPVPFEEALHGSAAKALDVEAFTERDAAAGFPPGSPFHRAAFALGADAPENTISEPVGGPNGYYVLSLVERVPPRIPEFAEVAAKATDDARNRLVEAAAERLARSAADAVRGGRPFADVAGELGIELRQTPSFNAIGGLPDLEVGGAILSAAATSNAGETPEPVRLAPDRWLALRVVSRATAAEDRLASLRGTVATRLRRERGWQSFESWQESLLRRADFEDRTRRPARDDAED